MGGARTIRNIITAKILWKRLAYLAVFNVVLFGLSVALAQDDSTLDQKSTPILNEESPSHSFLVGTLLYLPNRVLDVIDIFRLRVRIGPGIAAGARASKVAQVYAGGYASVYAGLPGPRLRRIPKSPVGLESHNGASVSVVDATADGGIGPDYSPTEIGAGLHLGILGFEFGIDPVEILDFATGILTLDIRDDDL